jgi:putative DNA methylase
MWANTVKSPSPAFSHVDTPLWHRAICVVGVKKVKKLWIKPELKNSFYRLKIMVGSPPKEAKSGNKISRGSFECILSGVPIKYEDIDKQANSKGLGQKLVTIIAEGKNGRVYLEPTIEMLKAVEALSANWMPDTKCRGTFASNAQGRIYGFKTFGDYFNDRQLISLETLPFLI